MKFASLSKTARTIGLMFLRSVMVGTSMQQSAQAQTRTQPQTPVRCVQPKGFFVEFQGIKFTPKQEAAFRRISAEMSKKAAEQMKNVRSEPRPDTPVDIA